MCEWLSEGKFMIIAHHWLKSRDDTWVGGKTSSKLHSNAVALNSNGSGSFNGHYRQRNKWDIISNPQRGQNYILQRRQKQSGTGILLSIGVLVS